MSMASHVSIEMQAVFPKPQGVVGLMAGMFVFWSHSNVQLACCIASFHLFHTCACTHMHTNHNIYTCAHITVHRNMNATNIHTHTYIYTHVYTWRLFFLHGRRENHLNFLSQRPFGSPLREPNYEGPCHCMLE